MCIVTGMKDKRMARLICIVLLATSVPAAAQERFKLRQNDVVVFFGGANLMNLQRAGHLEAVLTDAFAAARPKFRDLSWEADTVFHQGTVIERWRPDGFGDRAGQLKRVGATVIMAQFGGLESMSGLDGLQEFAKEYEQLIDVFEQQARQVILITPTPFENPPTPLIPDLTSHNKDLEAYVNVITDIGKRRKLIVVDLFHGASRGVTSNGMHVKPESQVDIARRIALQLGIPRRDAADLEPLRLAVIEKHRLWYDYWRPANWKLLYGDDSRRQFTRGGEDYIPFREEWKKLIPLIAKAEERVWRIADGEDDPGHSRPAPEVLHAAPDADVKAELASFSTSDDLRVNLFASEKEGLTSPLAIRWDPAGTNVRHGHHNLSTCIPR